MLKIDQLTAQGVRNYVRVCIQFCDLAEQIDHHDRQEFFGKMLELLPGIYRGNMRLPRVDVRYSYEPERFVSEKQYKAILRQLAGIMGHYDKFPYISSPQDAEKLQLNEATLSELLADIYLELKNFTSLYGTATLEDMNDSLAENQETFRKEWGIKVLTVMNIVHIYHFSGIAQAPTGIYLPEDTGTEGFDVSELEGLGTDTPI